MNLVLKQINNQKTIQKCIYLYHSIKINKFDSIGLDMDL